MGKWFERIGDGVSDEEGVRALITSVEQLPGLRAWEPPQGSAITGTNILSWGLPLQLTRSLGGVDAVQESIAKEILQLGRLEPDTLAEVGGAGLCIGLGAIGGCRIPRSSIRTADWRLVWPEHAQVDVEVTVARRKQTHLARLDLANALATIIFRDDRKFDLIVDLKDPTARQDRDAVVAAADIATVGQVQEVSGRWQVRAEEITREPTTILTGNADVWPTWWPISDARCFVCRMILAGPDAQRAPPQLRVTFGVPYASYINPVMRKANFPQGKAGLPFLLAIDVAELPGAFQELPRVVADFWLNWRALSGVLLFQGMVGVGRVGWMWRLLKNPQADVPLPESLCTGQADLPGAPETAMRFRNVRS